MSTLFPSQIDNVTSLFQAADNPQPAVLTVAATIAITTLTVSSTAGYPASYGVLQLDQEQIIYTGVTATSFIGCIRGANGTKATIHGTGCPAQSPFVAAHHNNVRDAVIAVETLVGANGVNINSLNNLNQTVLVTSPVFDLSVGALFYMNLTANVTTPTIINLPSKSVIVTFVISQDSFGGHTFTWPSNAFGGIQIGPAINQITIQQFVVVGSNLYAFLGVVY